MKNYFKTITKSTLLLAISLLLVQCETTELEILENPNTVPTEGASADFFLNNIERQTAAFFEDNTEEGMELTRMLHAFGPDNFTAYGTGQLNVTYSRLYATILPDLKAMYDLADASELTVHRGIGQILEAYLFVTMVDYLGDIPYSETTLGTANDNPGLDSGEDIYAIMLSLLDEAIVNLGIDAPFVPATELFYALPDGTPNTENYIRLANTLKLKIYLQSRLVDNTAASEINQIINDNNYIQDPSQDFLFQYSTVDQNPDSRHPIFARNYTNNPADYMSNSFMDLLVNGKSVQDPRTRYYFYRQTNAPGDDTQLACINQFPPSHYGPNDAFCFIEGGWWGRDHFNSQPIPADDGFRSAWGLYPIGGKFDDDSFTGAGQRDDGALGAGISPIMLSSYVKFMLAESAVTLGTSGDARMFLEQGIRESIMKVTNFIPTASDPAFMPSATDIQTYVDNVLQSYDDAVTDRDRLDVIVREYFIALFGNGIEAYNTYRRTGSPRDLQPALTSTPGIFVRSFFYPTNAVNNNNSLNQKPDQTVPVFWDEPNADNFVD